jgi:hypothetical protein
MADKNTIRLDRLRFLIGRWQGHGEGFGQKSEVEHTYQFILQNQFIQSKTKSITLGQDGSVKEIHEDLGIFSFDVARQKVILRGFYSEGYVNTFVMEDRNGDGNQLVFTTEKTENANGMMARLRMEVISENEYEMILDLAQQGTEFKPCQKTRMRKVQN